MGKAVFSLFLPTFILVDKSGKVPKFAGCKTVFIGGITDHFTEDTLRDNFAWCGRIENIRFLVVNGVFKGLVGLSLCCSLTRIS